MPPLATPGTGFVREQRFEWSQHGTLLSETTQFLPASPINPLTTTWSATRGDGASESATPFALATTCAAQLPRPVDRAFLEVVGELRARSSRWRRGHLSCGGEDYRSP